MGSGSKKKIWLTYRQIEERVIHLAEQLKDLPKPLLGIVPVARGGLVPAAMLAYHMGIIDIWPVMMKTYHGKEKSGQVDYYIPERLEERQGEGYLILDDICDTGETLKFLKGKLPKARTAVLLSKTEDHDFMTGVATNEFWYVFPWEVAFPNKDD